MRARRLARQRARRRSRWRALRGHSERGSERSDAGGGEHGDACSGKRDGEHSCERAAAATSAAALGSGGVAGSVGCGDGSDGEGATRAAAVRAALVVQRRGRRRPNSTTSNVLTSPEDAVQFGGDAGANPPFTMWSLWTETQAHASRCGVCARGGSEAAGLGRLNHAHTVWEERARSHAEPGRSRPGSQCAHRNTCGAQRHTGCAQRCRFDVRALLEHPVLTPPFSAVRAL